MLIKLGRGQDGTRSHISREEKTGLGSWLGVVAPVTVTPSFDGSDPSSGHAWPVNVDLETGNPFSLFKLPSWPTVDSGHRTMGAGILSLTSCGLDEHALCERHAQDVSQIRPRANGGSGKTSPTLACPARHGAKANHVSIAH